MRQSGDRAFHSMMNYAGAGSLMAGMYGRGSHPNAARAMQMKLDPPARLAVRVRRGMQRREIRKVVVIRTA